MKKLVYTLGTIAAVATPLVAVVSCGSSKGQTVEKLEKGSAEDFYSYDANGNRIDKNAANTEIATNGNGELVELGNGQNLGFKYLIKADSAKNPLTFDGKVVTDKDYRNMTAGLVAQVTNSLLENSSFASKVKNEFQFVTVVIIDNADKSLKATKNIFIPQITKTATDTDATWKSRANKVISAIFTNEKTTGHSQEISYSPSVIPVTAYDAPSTDTLTFDYSDDIVKLVRIEGQRIPKFNEGNVLPENLVNNIAERVLRNENTINAMQAGETEYALAYYNQMYISNIAAALHIGNASVLPRIIRENSMVANDASNGADVPFTHLPQNPSNFDRTLAGMADKISGLKFVKADPDFEIATSSFDVFKQGIVTSFNVDLAQGLQAASIDSKPNKSTANNTVKKIELDSDKLAEFRQDLTNKVLANKFLNEANKAENILGKFSLTSKADAYASLHQANGYIETLIAKTDADLESWEKLNDDKTLDDDTPLAETNKVIFNALKIAAKSMWLDGSLSDRSQDLKFAEMRDAVKHVSDFEKGTSTDVTETDYVLNTLFDWTATRVHQTLNSWILFDEDRYTQTTNKAKDGSYPAGTLGIIPDLTPVKFDCSTVDGINDLFKGKVLAQAKDIYKINWRWDSSNLTWKLEQDSKYTVPATK